MRSEVRDLGRLQQHRVAGQEGSNAVGVVVQERPVPGPNHSHHAARVVDDARALVREHERMTKHVRERAAAGAPAVVAGELERVEDLDALGLVVGLAALGDERLREPGVIANAARQPAQRSTARAGSEGGPGGLRGPRAGERRVHLRTGGRRDLGEEGARGRIDDVKR